MYQMQWEVWSRVSLQKAFHDWSLLEGRWRRGRDDTRWGGWHPEDFFSCHYRKDTPETMKIYERIGWSIFLVLIDSGSTHNFMSLALPRLLKLQPAEEGGMDVIIASGEKIRSLGQCVQIPVELQGRIFTVDFYILQLEGYGVVLGTQWLRILGPINAFMWNMEQVVLYGIKNRSGRSREFLSLYPKEAKNSKGVLKHNGKEKEKEVEQMLEEYGVIFAKPKERPPPHSHDHCIILQKGAGPVSVKAYRYPFFRKRRLKSKWRRCWKGA
jgi:hypothetical protein